MAIIITKTVKPSGGDYTSLSAAEAGEQRDLVTLNEIAILECYAMSDTTAVTISGWTTSATNYIKIYTPTTERGGPKWDATKYRMEVTNAVCLAINEDFVTVDGIQFKVIGATASLDVVSLSSVGAGAEFNFTHNIVNGSGNVNMRGLVVFDSQVIAKINNNLMYDCERSGTGNLEISACAPGTQVYNNTFIHGYRCVRITDTDATLKNNIAFGSSHVQNYYATFNAASDYNASDDATSTGGANDRINQTFSFTDAAGGDYSITSGDAGARDHGTDTSADGVTDDIVGTARPQNGIYDIGFFEVPTAGGGVLLKIITETAQVSDGYIRRMAMTRPVSETENLTEFTLRRGRLRRILSEMVNVTEALLRRGALKRIITETQNLTEGVVKSISALLIKVVNEGVQITGTIARRLGLTRIASESISLPETAVRRGALRRILNETASITEGVLRKMAIVRIASETVSLVATAVRRAGLVRVASEALNLAEGTLSYFGIVKIVNEGLNIVENIMKKLGLDTLGILGENLTLIFTSVRRGIKSITTKRGIVSKTPKREVKP